VNPFAAVAALRELGRSQWFDRKRIRDLQERKLRRLVDHAYRTVPYYRTRFDDAGIAPADIRTLEDLKHIPLTKKADLLAAGLEATLSSAFRRESLVCEQTSGSCGRPFRVMFDPRFVNVRNALFLRALTGTGFKLGRPLMLLTSDRRRVPGKWMRWSYSPLEDSPRRALVRLNEFRPWLLYGCMTPLRELATHIRDSGATAHRPQAIASTAEVLDPVTRCLLEETFEVEVYDLYGLTEMGMVGRECDQHRGYHVSEEAVIVEYEPTPERSDMSRLVMTNLELFAMPFLRYDTGDLGAPGRDETCACGRSLAMLERVEGRMVDCVRLSDGQLISPYRLTLALEQVPRIDRYQVVQDSFDAFTIRLESRGTADKSVEEAARSAVTRIVGQNAQVRVYRETTLEPPPGKKFRVVESRVAGAEPVV
jgi:phenylacetate-CoA ligase